MFRDQTVALYLVLGAHSRGSLRFALYGFFISPMTIDALRTGAESALLRA